MCDPLRSLLFVLFYIHCEDKKPSLQEEKAEELQARFSDSCVTCENTCSVCRQETHSTSLQSCSQLSEALLTWQQVDKNSSPLWAEKEEKSFKWLWKWNCIIKRFIFKAPCKEEATCERDPEKRLSSLGQSSFKMDWVENMAARSSRLKWRGTIWLVISNQLKHLNLW